jgi:hypothetical protein
MNTDEVQRIVAAAVAARGYRNGWTAEQFAARQVAKFTEELAEYAKCFSFSHGGPISLELIELGAKSRKVFDRPSYAPTWRLVKLDNAERARAELADLQVVILAAADALGFDVLEAARVKAEADVQRGVRAAAQ